MEFDEKTGLVRSIDIDDVGHLVYEKVSDLTEWTPEWSIDSSYVVIKALFPSQEGRGFTPTIRLISLRDGLVVPLGEDEPPVYAKTYDLTSGEFFINQRMALYAAIVEEEEYATHLLELMKDCRKCNDLMIEQDVDDPRVKIGETEPGNAGTQPGEG